MAIQRICQNPKCQKVFTARTTKTKFCSDNCAKAGYKERIRQAKINDSIAETAQQLSEKISGNKQQGVIPSIQYVTKISEDASILNDPSRMVDIKVIAAFTGFGASTLYRIIAGDPDFPRIKRGRSLRFIKEKVVNYLILKYGNYESQVAKAEDEGRQV